MYLDKLISARSLLLNALSNEILSAKIHSSRPVLTVIFENHLILYIRYNRVNEYSYHLQFSPHKLDRIRYDNMDEEWNVSTKPNHFHPRFDENAIQSAMIGDPEVDIPKIIETIEENYL